MKKIFGSIIAITFAAILYSVAYAQDTPNDVGEKQLARCDNNITRYSRMLASDHIEYGYLSNAIFTVPEREDSCDFYYSIKSPILAAYQTTVGNPTCSQAGTSIVCYGTIELGNYVRLDTYTRGTNNEFPFATVQDFTNNGAEHSWWFFGFSMYLPVIDT